METKEIILSQEEIQALKKAIFFLKFDCIDEDAELYASSRIINSFLKKILEIDNFKEIQQEKLKNISDDLLNNILDKYKSKDYFMNMKYENKIKLLKEVFYPYVVEESKLIID